MIQNHSWTAQVNQGSNGKTQIPACFLHILLCSALVEHYNYSCYHIKVDFVLFSDFTADFVLQTTITLLQAHLKGLIQPWHSSRTEVTVNPKLWQTLGIAVHPFSGLEFLTGHGRWQCRHRERQVLVCLFRANQDKQRNVKVLGEISNSSFALDRRCCPKRNIWPTRLKSGFHTLLVESRPLYILNRWINLFKDK